MKNRVFNYFLLSIICLGFCLPYVRADESDYNFSYVDPSSYKGCGNSAGSSKNGTGTLNGTNCEGNAFASSGPYKSTVYINDKTNTGTVTTAVPYSIVVLIDYSGSMINEKLDQARAALKSIIQAANNKNSDIDVDVNSNTEINVCSYARVVKCNGFKKISSFPKDETELDNELQSIMDSSSITSSWTFTQLGLNNAKEILSTQIKTSHNAPMVILISDGYPTKYSTTININEDKGNLSYSSYRYFYYTAKTLAEVKKNLVDESKKYATNVCGVNSDECKEMRKSNAKLITITTTGTANPYTNNSYDELVDFGMNPSDGNTCIEDYCPNTLGELKGLYGDENYRSTEAKTLYNWITKSEKVLTEDAIASVQKDPNKAIYRGVLSSDRSYIDYKFVNARNLTYWYDSGSEYKILFHLPFSVKYTDQGGKLDVDQKKAYDSAMDKIWAKIKSVEFSTDGGINFKKCNSSNNCKYGKAYGKDTKYRWLLKLIYKEATFKSIIENNGSFIVRINFTEKQKVDKSINEDSGITYSYEGRPIVDDYRVTKDGKLQDAIKNAFAGVSEVITKREGKNENTPINVGGNNYQSSGKICTEKDYIFTSDKVANKYYCLPDDTIKIGTSSSVKTINNPRFYLKDNYNDDGFYGSLGQCVPINNISIKYAVTESSEFKLGPFETVEFDGGGFSIGNDNSGAYLKNTVEWDYVAGNQSASIGFIESYHISGDDLVHISSSDEAPLEINTLTFANLSDIYTCNCSSGSECNKSSCSKVNINIGDVSDEINESVKKNIEKTNVSVKESLSNSAVQTYDSNDYDAVNLVDMPLDVSYHGVDSNGRTFTSVFNFAVKKACIIMTDDGEYTNGDVIYVDGECFSNSIESNKRQYFVPVKWNQNKNFELKIKDYANLSSYSELSVDYTGTTCKVNMSHEKDLYNCTEKNNDLECEANYYYRSIDVKKPFPDGKIGDNWGKWYEIDANKKRLENSFDNLHYKITFNKNLRWYDNYLDWTGMNSNDGTSKFISEDKDKIFNKKASNKNFCTLGKFGSDCDGYGD